MKLIFVTWREKRRPASPEEKYRCIELRRHKGFSVEIHSYRMQDGNAQDGNLEQLAIPAKS